MCSIYKKKPGRDVGEHRNCGICAFPKKRSGGAETFELHGMTEWKWADLYRNRVYGEAAQKLQDAGSMQGRHVRQVRYSSIMPSKRNTARLHMDGSSAATVTQSIWKNTEKEYFGIIIRAIFA